MKQTFSELFPEDLAQWLEEEILINRQITSSQVCVNRWLYVDPI